MRAVVLTEFGDPEVLRVVEVPDPEPGPDEVLVDVAASALNRADLLQRMGLYPDPFPAANQIPGLEFAGTVSKVGARVTSWSPGDRVMGIVSGGGQAEKLTVHERQVMAVPPGISLLDAAAIPEVFITAWDALVVQGGLTSGRWALVHAGASGVGTAAIQICRMVGARVAVTCSTSKVAACRELGADVVIDYTADDFVEAVRGATGGRGVDTVLDVIGGDYLARNLAVLAVKGRIVQVGTMAGKPAPIELGALMGKRASLIGTVLRPRPLEEKIAVTQRFAAEVLPHFANGVLAPVVDSVVAMSEIADGHRRMADNANTGKIIVDTSR